MQLFLMRLLICLMNRKSVLFFVIIVNDSEVLNQSDIHHEASLTGENLNKKVLSQLKNLGLRLDLCVSIGTDVCTVMLSEAR